MWKKLAVVLLLTATVVGAESTSSPFVMNLLPGDSDSTLAYREITGRTCKYWSIVATGDTVHFLVYYGPGFYERYIMGPGESASWVVKDGYGATDSIRADLRSASSKARVAMY